MKEVLKWYVAQTYINCNGEASVSFLSYINTYQVGLHWSPQFKNPDQMWFDTREEAQKYARQDQETVHATYLPA